MEPLIVSWFSDTSKSKTTEKLQICFCLKHSVFNSISRDLPIEHVVSRLFRMAFQWQAFWWNESCSKYLRFQHMELTTKWNKDVYWIIPMSVCDGVSVMYIIYLHNKYICKIHSLCAYCIMNISIISFHFNVYTCVSVYIYICVYIYIYTYVYIYIYTYVYVYMKNLTNTMRLPKAMLSSRQGSSVFQGLSCIAHLPGVGQGGVKNWHAPKSSNVPWSRRWVSMGFN